MNRWKIATIVLAVILAIVGLVAVRFQISCALHGGSVEDATVVLRTELPGLVLNMQACERKGETIDARILG